MVNWWLVLIVVTGVTLYYSAVVGGLFKESLMTQFRKYGEENRTYPLCRLLGVAGINSMVFAMVMPSLFASFSFISRLFPQSMFVLLGLAAWGASFFIHRRPMLRESLPTWYFDLLRSTSRSERRRIGYAWLRIPWQMRWRLNSDNKAFNVWAELVRLTDIYGAHDPNSPWDVWT